VIYFLYKGKCLWDREIIRDEQILYMFLRCSYMSQLHKLTVSFWEFVGF